jgi:hypothetical protein
MTMPEAPKPEPKVGDVVNSHRLTQLPDGSLSWVLLSPEEAAAAAAPPAKKWYTRKAILIPGIIVLVFILIIAIGSANRRDKSEAADTDKDTDSSSQVEEEPIEEEPEPEPEPVAEIGTLANPAPAGTSVQSTSFDGTDYSTLVVVNSWDAGAQIAGYNQFNDAPTAGNVYMLSTVTITNAGTTPVNPLSVEWGIKFLGADNIARDSASVVVETESYDVGDVYPGATASFQLVFEVPAGSTTGTWVFDGITPFYVLAA